MPPPKKSFRGPHQQIWGTKTSNLDHFSATFVLDTVYLRYGTPHQQTKMLVSIYNVSPKSWPTFRELWPRKGWDPFRHCDAGSWKVCLLSLVAIAPHLGDQIPKKNNFWGVNRNFQHNWQNIKTCIMKTTAPIPTKFCKVIKITNDGSELCWVESVRYLGVFIIRSYHFSCSFDNAKNLSTEVLMQSLVKLAG